MYGWQRRDALSDWTMQNEYNSPQAQMKRLKEAGLNPNMVYGSGTVAGQSSGQVRSSSPGNWNPQVPMIDVGGAVKQGLGAYIDIELKQAQTDNLKAQNNVILQDAVLKAAQVLSTTAGTEKTNVQTEFLKQNFETSLEAAKASLDKTVASTKTMLDENERRAAMQAPNLQAAYEKIMNMRIQRETDQERIKLMQQQVENLKKSGVLMEFEAKLRQMGLTSKDPLWMRALTQFLGNMGGEPSQQSIDALRKLIGQ